MKKILHLTLTKKPFDLTASGLKKYEYREKKPYWFSRLRFQDGKCLRFKKYDEIHYRNGYGYDKPFCKVEWGGISIISCNVPKESRFYPQFNEELIYPHSYYVIMNGRVLETKNWKNMEKSV
jgi:hypothetical protein